MNEIETDDNHGRSRYKSNRSLIRGLQILRVLNESEDGRATPTQIAGRSGIHRTTVCRILDTLEREGYVARSLADHSFFPTSRTAQLNSAVTDEVRAYAAAAPVLLDLQAEVTWPTDLCFPRGDAMIIRESTHRTSTLSFHRSMAGRTIPMLHTAAGRAYFAFEARETQQEILDKLARRSAPEDGALLRDAGRLRELLEKVRANGYATNDGEWIMDKKVGAIALPVFSRERVLGSLNIIFLRNVVPVEEALLRYVQPLRDAACAIEKAMLAQQAEN
jgi:IclR family mhp operon transcriptional activator